MNKICLLFPGQGSQYVGMGKALCERYYSADQTFQEASDVLGFDLKRTCFEGDLENLTKTENAQVAIITASVAAYRAFMEEISDKESEKLELIGAGHSLGEISALTCCDAIKFSDALKIARARAGFMQEAVPYGIGAMYAITGIDTGIVEKECQSYTNNNETVTVSNYNSPIQSVISGHKNAVEAVGRNLTDIGAKVIPLNVSAPFHSPLMQPAADNLKEELVKYKFNELKWPVLSCIDTMTYEGKDSIITNLTRQITQPVRWDLLMKKIWQQSITTAVELGPQSVLTNLMKYNVKGIKAFSSDKDILNDIKKSIFLLHHHNNDEYAVISQKDSLAFINKALSIAVCMKNRNWDNIQYQEGVIKPYKKVQMIRDDLEKGLKEPAVSQMREALEMLQSVFITKQVPLEEQIVRFNEIFEETGTSCLFADFKIN